MEKEDVDDDAASNGGWSRTEGASQPSGYAVRIIVVGSRHAGRPDLATRAPTKPQRTTDERPMTFEIITDKIGPVARPAVPALIYASCQRTPD